MIEDLKIEMGREENRGFRRRRDEGLSV